MKRMRGRVGHAGGRVVVLCPLRAQVRSHSRPRRFVSVPALNRRPHLGRLLGAGAGEEGRAAA
eukprot:3977050-Alexandrium_andersonii.AAC.1